MLPYAAETRIGLLSGRSKGMAVRPAPGMPSSAPTGLLKWGSASIALAGVAVFAYGVIVLILNFTAFIELGLNRQLVGTSASARQADNPTLYNFISHLQVNLAAFIMTYGLALAAFAWLGIRRGQRWALWTALGPTYSGSWSHYQFITSTGWPRLVTLDRLSRHRCGAGRGMALLRWNAEGKWLSHSSKMAADPCVGVTNR